MGVRRYAAVVAVSVSVAAGGSPACAWGGAPWTVSARAGVGSAVIVVVAAVRQVSQGLAVVVVVAKSQQGPVGIAFE